MDQIIDISTDYLQVTSDARFLLCGEDQSKYKNLKIIIFLMDPWWVNHEVNPTWYRMTFEQSPVCVIFGIFDLATLKYHEITTDC